MGRKLDTSLIDLLAQDAIGDDGIMGELLITLQKSHPAIYRHMTKSSCKQAKPAKKHAKRLTKSVFQGTVNPTFTIPDKPVLKALAAELQGLAAGMGALRKSFAISNIENIAKAARADYIAGKIGAYEADFVKNRCNELLSRLGGTN